MRLTWLHLFVYGLACFRLAVLLSEDAGPAKVFSKLRAFLKKEAKTNPTLRKSDIHHGVDCLRCSSVWVAAPVAAYAYHHDRLDGWAIATGDIILLTMAFSAMAILWNRVPKQ